MFFKSEAEPSDVHDHFVFKVEAHHDGHQSDQEDLQDCNQFINSDQSRGSVSCEKVVKVFAGFVKVADAMIDQGLV